MFQGLQLHFRSFISFSIFIFLALFIYTSVFYVYTESSMRTNLIEAQMNTTRKVQEQLDTLLTQLDNISISVNASDLIMNTLENIPNLQDENYFDNYPWKREEVRNYLFSLTALKPEKGRISLVSKYGDYIDLGSWIDSQDITKGSVRDLDIFKTSMHADTFKIILPPQKDEWTSKGNSVFSVIRPLRDYYYNIQGFIEVSYDVNLLDQLFLTSDKTDFFNGAVMDSGQQVVYNRLPQSR